MIGLEFTSLENWSPVFRFITNNNSISHTDINAYTNKPVYKEEI